MPSCGSRNRPATYLTFHRAWHTSPQSRSASFICPAISQIETLVLDSHEDVGFIHPNAWGRMIFEYLDGLKSAPCTPVGRKIGAQWVTTEAVLVALSFKDMDAHVASFAAWRGLSPYVFCAASPARLHFRRTKEDAAAEQGAA